MVNNKNFEDMPFIVFFNKRDLFEEKIKKKSIAVAFPNYQVSPGIYKENGPGDCRRVRGAQRAKIAEKVHKPPLGVNVINFELNGFNAFI